VPVFSVILIFSNFSMLVFLCILVDIICTDWLFCSTQGDIRLWDLRKSESVKTINTQQGLTAVDAHQYSELLAW